MASDAEFQRLQARVAALESIVSMMDGRIVLQSGTNSQIIIDRHSIEIRAVKITIVSASETRMHSGGNVDIRAGGTVTTKGSKITQN